MESFQYIFELYALSDRHYHDINHIIKMLKGAYLYGDRSKIFDTAKTESDFTYYGLTRPLYDAILFHDVIYNIPAMNGESNEQLSAEEYQTFAMDFGRRDKEIEQVSNMIRATEHHFDGTLYDDYLTNLLLDLDILGFADDWVCFAATQKLVDAEFLAHYPKEVVLQGRKDFLKNIVDNELLQYRVIDKNHIFRNKAYENIETLLFQWENIYAD